MPTAMRLAVLVSLFAMTVFIGAVAAERGTDITTGTAHRTSLAAKGNDSPFNATTTNSTQQPPTTHRITTGVTSENVSSTSPQTPNRTEETRSSVSPPQATTTNQTSNGTVSYRSTSPPASELANVTATNTVNTTSPGLSHDWGKGDLAANPGLVVIICIFCIICALVLVVATVRCIRSPRSNFERLQDVPMSNVNEESPFARHAK